MGAAVQGMDETVINGANLFYPRELGLGESTKRNDWLQGLVNGAPYLCCAGVSCWCTDWLNNKFGRRKVIFITCVISAVTCFLQAFGPAGTAGWHYLFAMRFLLGFGIGPKSATVSVYLAECSTKQLRGIVCMNWQTFTAFGIMWGYVCLLYTSRVGRAGIAGGLNWRLMLASAMIPAILVLFQIPFCPESPRWLMGKGRYKEAYDSTVQIRNHRILACRDLFYQHVLLMEENSLQMSYWTRLKEVFTVRRNRNALVSAFICAFMQQFCAINVIAYYSSAIFLQSGFSEISSLCASLGFGLINFFLPLPWPSMLRAFKPQGSFGFYAAWNVIGWFLVYFFMPETKQLTLEELDEVSDVPLMERAAYQFRELWPNFQIYFLRRKNVQRQPPLDKHHRMVIKAEEWNEKAEVEEVEITKP